MTRKAPGKPAGDTAPGTAAEPPVAEPSGERAAWAKPRRARAKPGRARAKPGRPARAKPGRPARGTPAGRTARQQPPRRTSWIPPATAALAVIAAAAGLGYWYGHRRPPAGAAPASQPGPVARVTVVPLREGTIEETLTAYGTVVAAPGEAQIFSVPYAARVRRVLVTLGQGVAAGATLVTVEPSSEERLQLDQARNDRGAAQGELKTVEERLALKLTTRAKLIQAQQRLHAAELRVRSLERRGVGRERAIRAREPGIVSRVAVQQGQIVPAGTVLLEAVREDQIYVRLGIEDEDVVHLHTGQAVQLAPISAPPGQAGEGHVRLITRQVNPRTRLVDVFVAPPAGVSLLLDQYVRASVVIASQRGLLAPRSAVLPEQGRHVLYTVREGRAVRHTVGIGLENPRELEVFGEGLRAGEPVVVAGNAELRDGMAVEVEANR